MATANNQFDADLMIGETEDTPMNLSLFGDGSLAEFLEQFKTSEEFSSQTTLDFSTDLNFTLIDEDSSSASQQAADTFPSEIQSNSERLQIIEQPYQSSKLRYRTEYIKDKNRLGVLKNKNKQSHHQGPAVRIPQCYRNPNDEHSICVYLVTVKHKKTNLHYFHPYELENPCNEQLNDRKNNAIWFPIEQANSDGSISFPLLRIVKKKGLHMQNLGRLRVFDCHGQTLQNQSSPQFSSGEEPDIVKEYKLDRFQLAFIVGKKQTVNGQLSMVLYANTTVLSEEMCENVSKQLDSESESEPMNLRSNSSSPDRLIYKYAPRSGSADINEEVLVFLTKNLNLGKHDDLQITVECDTSNGRWSQPVSDLEIKKRMISFKTPIFPYPMPKTMPVDIILRQNNRILGVLKYSYLADFN